MFISCPAHSSLPRLNFGIVGNKRFKISVENHLNSYIKAPTRTAKSAIITNLVSSIRESSTTIGGGFVRYDESTGRWYEVGEKIARDKVGQALRDAARQRRIKEKKAAHKSQSSARAITSPPEASMPGPSLDIDLKNAQHEQPPHLKQEGDEENDDTDARRRRMSTTRLSPPPPPSASKQPRNQKPIQPLSTKCYHFVHDKVSVPPEESSYKHEPPGGPRIDTARMHFNRTHEPGVETADELLEWFEHEF